jgi:hypothetical protein
LDQTLGSGPALRLIGLAKTLSLQAGQGKSLLCLTLFARDAQLFGTALLRFKTELFFLLQARLLGTLVRLCLLAG